MILRNLLRDGKKELHEQILAYLPKVPETTVIVVYEAGVPDQRTRLFKALNQPKSAEQFTALTGPQLVHWIVDRVTAAGATIAPSTAQRLANIVGTDLWRLANEIDKLILFAQGQDSASIEDAAVTELVVEQSASDAFRLIEAIARGETGRALAELETLVTQGEAELYLLSMIAYQYRTLIQVAEAYERGIRQPAALARELRMAPFVAEKNLRLVRNVSANTLVRRLRRILDYDAAIKTGELEPRIGLELLITEFAT